MLTKRVIPCMDVKDGRVVKGVNFVNLRDAGDPIELAQKYDAQKADEVVFLDITATHEGRATTVAMASRASEELLSLFSQINACGQTLLMVTHSVRAACYASRVLFIKDGAVFHQLYRGDISREAMYQKISDTLTLLTTGGDRA